MCSQVPLHRSMVPKVPNWAQQACQMTRFGHQIEQNPRPHSPRIQKHVTSKLHSDISEPASISAEMFQKTLNKLQAKSRGAGGMGEALRYYAIFCPKIAIIINLIFGPFLTSQILEKWTIIITNDPLNRMIGRSFLFPGV